MTRAVAWIWRHGIVSTFMTGFFVILPIAITLAIMGWAAGKVIELLGPGSYVGRALQYVGLQFLNPDTRQWIGTLIGWGLVIGAIWLIGLFVKTLARQRVERSYHDLMEKIPIVNMIYKPVAQVVGMLKKDESDEMKSMAVVFCSFGEAHGGGFLGLLASPDRFHFGGQDCLVVYIPTSPVPMSGGIVFVPAEKVDHVDMQVDDLMQIYFSLGVMAPRVVPDIYRAA